MSRKSRAARPTPSVSSSRAGPSSCWPPTRRRGTRPFRPPRPAISWPPAVPLHPRDVVVPAARPGRVPSTRSPGTGRNHARCTPVVAGWNSSHDGNPPSSCPCCTAMTRWGSTPGPSATGWWRPVSHSTIYIEIPDPSTADRTRPYLDYRVGVPARRCARLPVRHRIGDGPLALAERPEPVVINYHSITPPAFSSDRGTTASPGSRWRPASSSWVGWPRVPLWGSAVSRFDEDGGQLRRAGCTRTQGHPGGQRVGAPGDRTGSRGHWVERLVSHQPRCTRPDRWLSVGRLAPNKAPPSDHRRPVRGPGLVRSAARLTLVGAPSEPAYARALRRYVASLGLSDAVDFVSDITDAELAAYYQFADVLVMLSDHEGFKACPGRSHGREGFPIVAYDRRCGGRDPRWRRCPARREASAPGRR